MKTLARAHSAREQADTLAAAVDEIAGLLRAQARVGTPPTRRDKEVASQLRALSQLDEWYRDSGIVERLMNDEHPLVRETAEKLPEP